ncbi:MAG: alanine racemase [Dehalococcoidia bacterium]|nr:alanine racemase [Dehalococcoidia bacterium]
MPTATSTPAKPLGSLRDLTTSRNAWIEIDLDALDHNVATMRSLVGPGIELIAVVKANAYGAGAEVLAPALEAAGVERFAVVWPAEALNLRAAGVTRPILVLGHAFPADAPAAIAANITLTCHSLALGHAISEAALARGTTATVHIKVDTGLHRFGVNLDQAVALAQALRSMPGLDVEGLTTHMANADEPDDSFSELQDQRFAHIAELLPWIRYRHTANSATALRRDEFRYDGVRLGLALHGIQPANTPPAGLRPILSVRARVARVSDVPPGEGVSYGLRWHPRDPARVALVPVGYGDGWRRSLGNEGHVLIAGHRCPMVGTLCMDQFIADVTALPSVSEGDEITLLGRQGDDELSATEVAAVAGTIPWDIFASLQARLPRIYHRHHEVTAVIGP